MVLVGARGEDAKRRRRCSVKVYSYRTLMDKLGTLVSFSLSVSRVVDAV